MKSKTDKEVIDSNYLGKDIKNVIYAVYFFF